MIPISVRNELQKSGWKYIRKYDKQEEFFIKGFWCVKDSNGRIDVYKGWNVHTETGILHMSNIPVNKLLAFIRQIT